MTVEHLMPTPGPAGLPGVWRELDQARRDANFRLAVRYADDASNGDLLVAGVDLHVVTGRYRNRGGDVVLLLSGDCGAVHRPDDELERRLWIKLSRAQLDSVAFLASVGDAPVQGRTKRMGRQVAVTGRTAAGLATRGLVEVIGLAAARLTPAGEAVYIAHRTRKEPT